MQVPEYAHAEQSDVGVTTGRESRIPPSDCSGLWRVDQTVARTEEIDIYQETPDVAHV